MRTSKIVTTLAFAGLLATAGTAGQAAAACAPAWRLVSAPATSAAGSGAPTGASTWAELTDVHTLSAKDTWFTGDRITQPDNSLTLRWNGRSLGTAPAPAGSPLYAPGMSTGTSSFDSDGDGWRVVNGAGPIDFSGYGIYAVEHWSGGRWTMTPTAVPTVGTGITINGVIAVSPTNAWLIGTYYKAAQDTLAGISIGAVIEHWNGSQWSVVANPASERDGTYFSSGTVVSPTDIWAVGQTTDADGTGVPFAEHYDGRTWSVVPAPPGNGDSTITAISGDGPHDAWAAGSQLEPGTQNLAAPFVEHWDGSGWHAVDLPDIGNALLYGVYAASPTDVWAVGKSAFGLPEVFLHWNGSTWTAVPEPGPREYNLGYIYLGISGSGPGDVWAVGVAENYGDQALTPLIAHLSCG